MTSSRARLTLKETWNRRGKSKMPSSTIYDLNLLWTSFFKQIRALKRVDMELGNIDLEDYRTWLETLSEVERSILNAKQEQERLLLINTTLLMLVETVVHLRQSYAALTMSKYFSNPKDTPES
jgi:hypothetical protein